MASIDETRQGVHPFTLAWWRELPECFRRADRVQGYRIAPAWDGLNRDPRLVTGWDKWYRTNASTKPWEATVAFTRTFRATPHVPLVVKSWHTPSGEGSTTGGNAFIIGESRLGVDELGTGTAAPMHVRHVVRNHTGTIVLDEGLPMYGPHRESLTSHVTPDRFGVVQVTIEVTVAVPDGRDLLDAVHVGRRDVQFDELPAADHFRTAAAYPLLRYLDGIGHQAGYLSDMVNDMHEGDWTNPVTAPESSLPMLAALLGVSGRYARSLSRAELREHLVAIVEGANPAAGSRDLLALTAQQWLTGTRQVSVVPGHEQPGLLPAGADPQFSILILARADEVPGNDLAAFAEFLNGSGVVPAGYKLVVAEATQSWDAWEAAVGPTWNDLEASTKTWNDSDSAGVELDYTEGTV